MTLTTYGIVKSNNHSIQEIFGVLASILTPPEHNLLTREDKESYYDKMFMLETIPGQGLPAWLQVEAKVDSVTEIPTQKLNIENLFDTESGKVIPDGYILFSLDTGYGYQSVNPITGLSENIHEMHARIVSTLIAWGETHNADISYQDEYSGEWFNDHGEGLLKIASRGDEAFKFFCRSIQALKIDLEQQ